MWQFINTFSFQPWCIFEPLRKLPKLQRVATEQQGVPMACRWVSDVEAKAGLRLRFGHKREILISLLGNPMVDNCQSPASGFSRAKGHSKLATD